MLDNDAFYDQPSELTAQWGHHRIYAPQAYARIRTARTLPIVLPEAAALGQYYPICWERTGAGVRLVALMHLLPEEMRHTATIQGGLPLVAQAYPFVIPGAAEIAEQKLIVDRTIADKPTDVGAPLVLDTGRLSKASMIRARTAIQVSRALESTQALALDLDDHGLLEPWPLDFELGDGYRIKVDNLSVVSANRLGDPILFPLVENYGSEAGLFLSYARISLFRVMPLLNSAKAFVQRTAMAARSIDPFKAFVT